MLLHPFIPFRQPAGQVITDKASNLLFHLAATRFIVKLKVLVDKLCQKKKFYTEMIIRDSSPGNRSPSVRIIEIAGIGCESGSVGRKCRLPRDG